MKDNDYLKASKDRLAKIVTKKIQTTMIGAIADIEEYFSYLWNVDNPTAEDLEFKTLFDDLRQSILDRGNNQIRNIKVELDQYDIHWNRHQVKFINIRKDNNEG